MASTETSDDPYDYMCVICGCLFRVESECKEHVVADHHVTSGGSCRIPRKKSNKALIKKGRKASLVPKRKTKSTTKHSKKSSLTKNCETSFLLPPLELVNDHLLHQLSSSESKRATATGLGDSESNHDVTVVWSTEELWERNGNEDSVTSCYMCYYCRAEFATVGLCRLHIRTNHTNAISTQNLMSKTNKATLKDKTSRKRKQADRRSRTDTMMSSYPGGSLAGRTWDRLPTIDDLLTLSSCILAFRVWEGEPTPEAEGAVMETCDGRDSDGQGVGRRDAVDASRDGTPRGTNAAAKKTYQCSECSQKFPTLEECSKHMIRLHLPTEGDGDAEDPVPGVVHSPAIGESNNDHENSSKSFP